MIRLRFAVVAATLALVGARAAAAQELVVNGGFETVTGNSTFPDWPAEWSASCPGFGGIGMNHANTGTYGVYLGNGCTLSQSIATTAGQSYTFSFWLRSTLGQSLSARWNGVQQIFANDTITGGFVQLSAVVTAVGASSTIEFASTITAGQYLSIDDISVQAAGQTPTGPSTTVPEPSTVALTTVGLLGVAGAARRRRRRA
jgi:hypothetical protein